MLELLAVEILRKFFLYVKLATVENIQQWPYHYTIITNVWYLTSSVEFFLVNLISITLNSKLKVCNKVIAKKSTEKSFKNVSVLYKIQTLKGLLKYCFDIWSFN